MKNYEFKVGDKTYNLRLNTLQTIRLEKDLGANPLSIFIGERGEEKLPSLEDMAKVLFYCLQAEHAEDFKKINAVYDLFDEYIEQGGNTIEFVEIVLEVFRISGLIPKEEDEGNTSKN